MPFLVVLGRFAAFTDVFLSGLVIPLIPTILQHRAHVPHQQVQIWTSVLVSAYGGAFAVVSPLMPFLTRQGPTGFVVLFAGLACAAAAFALLQFSRDLSLLILARALQGLAAAAITGASSGLLATAASASTSTGPTWFSPAFLQSAAMTTAPFIAGHLHDYYNPSAVFYCAYAFVALNMLLSLVAFSTTRTSQATTDETAGLLDQTQQGGYGTMPSGTGSSSRRSSRSISPTSIPARLSRPPAPAALAAATPWSPRLLVAFCGYLVLGLLTSALQSVLPLFVQRYFDWSVLNSGYMFVPLSAPAAVIGLFSGTLATRVPKSTRFLTTMGFVACLPAFLYLGQLRENSKLVQHAFLLTLSGISFATGLCGEPLVQEIANVVGSSAGDSWSATAQATALPNLANAWGSLAGPLFAGAVNYLWGWQTMNKSLAVAATGTGVLSLLFLQGWIGSPYPDIPPRRTEPSYDEESAPLLANGRSNGSPYDNPEACGKEDRYGRRQSSDDVSPLTRGNGDRKHRPHRRHFSVDNFSVATTAGPGSMDSSTSSVRFQAALETPVQGLVSSGSKRAEACDSASKASNAERRYVMREAPHAPATDPLLAAGSLYVIDEERDTARGVESERQKRRVVVFPEGTAPPELLERHRHHVVAINALDGTAQMVSNSTDNHAVHVSEETAGDEPAFEETTSRRYVVVVVEGEDAESE
ncbi:major facilitator superfamily domain-containing protein [Parachaetomium inaequale]|uniref:Major facilitator superfamily domain-containing protein n=1 Tax=Parachaetomium inaequale TaxID=2588326 RepID=A0AAN6PIE5_9PEZI|nr:major facilitator superfamily domain-containing protein [Parachaetomium inaequale]